MVLVVLVRWVVVVVVDGGVVVGDREVGRWWGRRGGCVCGWGRVAAAVGRGVVGEGGGGGGVPQQGSHNFKPSETLCGKPEGTTWRHNWAVLSDARRRAEREVVVLQQAML